MSMSTEKVLSDRSSSMMTSDSEASGARPLPYVVVLLLQLLGIMVMGTVTATPLLIVWKVLRMAVDSGGQIAGLVLIPVAFNAIGLLICAQVLALYYAFCRGPPVGEYAVNSAPFLRWWFVSRLLSSTHPVYMIHFEGTVLHTAWLRLLGAQIGHGACVAAGAVITDPVKLQLGAHATIGRAATVASSCVRDGVLILGPIRVGEKAEVGPKAVLLPHSSVAANACVPAQGVVKEGEHFSARKPPGDPMLPTLPVHPKYPAGPVAWACVFLNALLPLLPITAAAYASYMMLPRLARDLDMFVFFDSVNFPEGPMLYSLFCILGPMPLLGFTPVMAASNFRVRAFMVPDRLLEIIAKLTHVPIKPAQVRLLLQTPMGLGLIRGFLPKGLRLVGNAGDHENLAFLVPGRLCMRHLFYEAITLPIAQKHKVLGVVWMVGAAFCLCGLMQTVSNTGGIYACVLLRRGLRNVRGAAPVIHMTRELQLALQRWSYDRYMKLYAGTHLLLVWYRFLGARIGRRVMIHDMGLPPDRAHLWVIGSKASIGEGSVTQGRLCVGYGAVVAQDVVMVNNARVGERAVVPPRSTVTCTSDFQPPSPPEQEQEMEEGKAEGGGQMLDEHPSNQPSLSQSANQSVNQGHSLSQSASGNVDDLEGAPWRLAPPCWPTSEDHLPSAHYPPHAILTYLLLPLRTLLQYILLAILPAITTVTTVCFAFYPTVVVHSYLPNVEVGPGWSLAASACMLPLTALLLQLSLLLTTVALHWLLYPLTALASFRPWFMPYHLRRFLRLTRLLTNNTVGEAMRGSVLLPLYLSLLGCRCSPSAFINSLRITDPVSCEFGPQAVVDAEALIAPITTVFRDSGNRDGMLLVRRRTRVHGRVGVGAVIVGDAKVMEGAEVTGGRLLADGEVALPGKDTYVLADKLAEETPRKAEERRRPEKADERRPMGPEEKREEAREEGVCV